jgi:4-hydroxy-tetrahydrodipicolinate synthase
MTVEEARARFRGVVAPIATILNEDGTPDLEATASNTQWLIDRGARQGNTIFIAVGAGGEFSVLSTEERKQAIGVVADVSAGRIPIIAGAQSTDIRETIEICQFCEERGVEAVQIAAPFYYDVNPDDSIAWLEEVARHTEVGFSIYNHWYGGSKYDMPVDLVDRLLDIPNSILVKWSSVTTAKFYEGLKRFGHRAVMVDNTLFCVWGHVLGCQAWISHVPNFYPEFTWRVWDLMEEGRYKEAQQVYDEFMVPFLELVAQVKAVTVGDGVFVKVAMEAIGLPVGYSSLPSRHEAVTPETREGFRRLLDRVRVAA